MRLLIYDTERETANGYLPRAITKAAQALLGESHALLCDHGQVVACAGSGQWDGLLAIGGAGGDPHLLSALMQTGIPRVLWATEDPYERRLIEQAERAFDHVFSNDHTCQGATPKTTFLPLAAEPSMHWREVRTHDSDYRHDLTFVGTAWPNRVASLQKLLAALPSGLKIHLALPWNRYLPEPRLNGVGVLPRQRLGISDLCDVWNESRVVLTIGREFAAGSQRTEEIVGSSPPPRVYETALAGGFQVALMPQGMQLETSFGRMIPIAATEEEAAEQILEHLSAPAQRIEVAQAIQDHTLKLHTYGQRLNRVLEVFAKIRGQRQHPPVVLPSRPAGVLHVAHNLVGLGLRQPGGTEAYVDRLARQQHQLKPDRRVLAIAPKTATSLGLLDYGSCRPQLINVIDVGPISPFAGSHPDYEQALSRVIRDQGIGIVHIHHLIGWPLGLPIIAKSLGCRVVITLHDYYLACHRYTLQTPNGEHCAIDRASHPAARCMLCLRTDGLDGSERNKRLPLARLSLDAADQVLASTESSAAILTRIFPEVRDRIAVVEMLTPKLEQLQRRGKSGGFIPLPLGGPKLRVGVIGNQVPQKGIDVLKQVLIGTIELPFLFTILGSTPEFESTLDEVSINQSAPHIERWQGPYTRRDLIDVLDNLDVALFLSTWPETYNISLGEAMVMGVIPVATAIGAHQDRIQHLNNGLLVPPGKPEAVIKALMQLYADPLLVKKLKTGAQSTSLVSAVEHAKNIEAVYTSLKPMPHRGFECVQEIELADQISLRMVGPRLAHACLDLPGVNWDAPV